MFAFIYSEFPVGTHLLIQHGKKELPAVVVSFVSNNVFSYFLHRWELGYQHSHMNIVT
jgi:hypothetical protein